MSRQYMGFPAFICTFAMVTCAAYGQVPMPKQNTPAELNQVYAKIILPGESADSDGERVVESWVAQELKKRGQPRFRAATQWVCLDRGELESTSVWDGNPIHACPVGAEISQAPDDHIKVLLRGWHPGGADIIVSLKDEPGGRAFAPVEELRTELGMPYVVILVAPPAETPDASANGKNETPLSGGMPGPRLLRFGGARIPKALSSPVRS